MYIDLDSLARAVGFGVWFVIGVGLIGWGLWLFMCVLDAMNFPSRNTHGGPNADGSDKSSGTIDGS